MHLARGSWLAAASLAALAFAHPAAAGQATVFVNFSGFNSCDVCGAADYATVGAGMEDRTFADPIPAGAVPTQIQANIQGTCDDTVSLSIDGTLVGSSAFSGTGCACGSCFDGTIATSAVYADGFPGWIAGGNQVLHVDASAVALDGVDVTIFYRLCGDGATDAPEACDTAGDSATCDADCTPVACGDGRVNQAAGERCDVSVENAVCDDDCTLVECGDTHVNPAAGEACDDGNTTDGDGCSAQCQIEGGPNGAGGGGPGAGGASSGPAGGGASSGDGGSSDGGSGPSGPTANAAGQGGGDGDGDDGGSGDGGDDDADPSAGGADGAASSDPPAAGGCGCEVLGESTPRKGGLAALTIGLALARLARRTRRRSGTQAADEGSP